MTKQQLNAILSAACAKGGEFMQIAMEAMENAHITIHEERAAPAEDEYRLTLGTLEGSLAYCEDKEVTEWFIGQGVSF